MKFKKNVFKFYFKLFLVITLFLILFNNFLNINVCRAFESNILFVGGNGDKNYSRIQEAIDNSKENDTIIVLEGLYNESVFINKSIKLIGLDKNNVIINGNNNLYVFFIKSSYVNISGFTISGGKIGIYVSGKEFLFNNFSNNNILNNVEGIRFVNTSFNKIFNNTIQSNSGFGIVFYESCNNNISENLLFNNTKAFNMNKWSNNNVILKNNITKNKIGISLDFSFYNLIFANYIKNNSCGIYLTNSENNNITNNYIEFNNESGIFISNSNNNTISFNIFLENNQDIKPDTKPPDIKVPGFDLIFFFVAIIIFICIKKHIL